jgi:hypothetical protein
VDELGLRAASRKRRLMLGLEMIIRLPRRHVGKRGAKGYHRKERSIALRRGARPEEASPLRTAAGWGVRMRRTHSSRRVNDCHAGAAAGIIVACSQ